MESHHLRITAHERQALLEQYRKGVSTQVRLRAHILLLLAEGYSWSVIAGVLFCSTRTIARWKSRVELAADKLAQAISQNHFGGGARSCLQPALEVLNANCVLDLGDALP